MNENSQPIFYQTEEGAIALKADANQETLWATQKQLAELFGVNTPTINEHIKNIFNTGELEKESTIRKFRIVQKEGKREVGRNIDHYNLDMMISVGYRVNSKMATKFRKWATQTLKQHITQGYTLNPSRITQNYEAFLQAVEEIKVLAEGNQQIEASDILALVKTFAHTWFSLESYDEDKLPSQGQHRHSIQLEATELYQAIETLKLDLIRKGEATSLFAQEKQTGSLAGIIGNIYQSAFGEEVYPT